MNKIDLLRTQLIKDCGRRLNIGKQVTWLPEEDRRGGKSVSRGKGTAQSTILQRFVGNFCSIEAYANLWHIRRAVESSHTAYSG